MDRKKTSMAGKHFKNRYKINTGEKRNPPAREFKIGRRIAKRDGIQT
jgi:hypothetical protein